MVTKAFCNKNTMKPVTTIKSFTIGNTSRILSTHTCPQIPLWSFKDFSYPRQDNDSISSFVIFLKGIAIIMYGVKLNSICF